MNTTEALTECFNGGSASVIEALFDVMERAEIVIEEQARKIECAEAAARVRRETFAHVCPPELLRGKAQFVYDAHCIEIAARIRDKKDPAPATCAERYCMMSQLSGRAPLTPQGELLYLENALYCLEATGKPIPATVAEETQRMRRLLETDPRYVDLAYDLDQQIARLRS
jgi:hypothetical protein